MLVDLEIKKQQEIQEKITPLTKISKATGINKSLLSLASELIGTSDFYALFTGKDIGTGQKRSRLVAADWVLVSIIPISRLAKVGKFGKILKLGKNGKRAAKGAKAGKKAAKSTGKKAGKKLGKKTKPKKKQKQYKKKKAAKAARKLSYAKKKGGNKKKSGKRKSAKKKKAKPKTIVKGSPSKLPAPVGKVYEGYDKSGWRGNYKGQPAGPKAGGRYVNKNKALPVKNEKNMPVTYKKFDIKSKKPHRDRDAKRFVKSSDGHVYYTKDHYRSFMKIK